MSLPLAWFVASTLLQQTPEQVIQAESIRAADDYVAAISSGQEQLIWPMVAQGRISVGACAYLKAETVVPDVEAFAERLRERYQLTAEQSAALQNYCQIYEDGFSTGYMKALLDADAKPGN